MPGYSAKTIERLHTLISEQHLITRAHMNSLNPPRSLTREEVEAIVSVNFKHHVLALLNRAHAEAHSLEGRLGYDVINERYDRILRGLGFCAYEQEPEVPGYPTILPADVAMLHLQQDAHSPDTQPAFAVETA